MSGMEGAVGFQELLDRARAGDSRAVDRLLETLRPALSRIAREYADPARAEESASDLVQEAWLRAWQRLEQFRGGESDDDTKAMFLAWAGRIAHRLGLNARRDRNVLRRRPAGKAILPLASGLRSGPKTRRAVVADTGPTPSARIRRSEEAALVQAALEKLPVPFDRDLVRLRIFDGISLRQAAERLGVGYDRARERWAAILKILGRELGSLG